MISKDLPSEPQGLLDRLRAFGMPCGEDAARRIQGVRILEQGEMKSAPEAPWIPFTSETTIDAKSSNFCWNANMRSGRLRSVAVTDAYENGHGRLVAKIGGVIPVANLKGLDFDKGELQRYLSSIVFCPPILIHHTTLEWTVAGPRILHVRDTADPTGAAIDLELGENGAPLAVRAERPRAVGKRTILTAWSATCRDPKEWEGLRVPSHLEVNWHLAEGQFTYYRSEVTSLEITTASK
jgi:hypothetical protein